MISILRISEIVTFFGGRSGMPQYCDSNELEKNWFHWLLSTSVPDLEVYRIKGLLWTKVIGKVLGDDGNPIKKNGSSFPNALHPKRLHCVLGTYPIYFESDNGKLIFKDSLIDNREGSSSLSRSEELHLLSLSDIHNTNCDLKIQYDENLKKLRSDNYILEIATETAWHLMLQDVNKMCQGIATKFNLPTEEELLDLSNEALLQVMNKLKNRKLVYTPGRAPVFNLLTTTIHRCMYSIMNRRKNQKNGMYKLIDEMKAGSLPDSHRSFRMQSKSTKKLKQ